MQPSGLLAHAGQIADAISDCNKAIGIDCNFVRAYERAGRANLALGNSDEAMLFLDKAISIVRTKGGSTRSLESERMKVVQFISMKKQIEAHLRNHDGQRALAKAKQLEAIAPGSIFQKLAKACAFAVTAESSGIDDVKRCTEESAAWAELDTNDRQHAAGMADMTVFFSNLMTEGAYLTTSSRLLKLALREAKFQEHSTAAERNGLEEAKSGIKLHKSGNYSGFTKSSVRPTECYKSQLCCCGLLFAQPLVGMRKPEDALNDCNEALRMRSSYHKARVVRHKH